jgi:hypothetical protein
VNVVASRPNAGEEGPTAGEFTVTRTGSTEAALTVNLAIGGSAINGTDYSPLGTSVTFASGQSTVEVPVQPYADSLVEVPEVAELIVLAGAGYIVGASARAQVIIADLPERISIQTLEPLASRQGPLPGYFLLSRSAGLDHGTVVRLAIGGTAVNGTDYQRITTLVVLNPAQSSLLIPVTPAAGLAVLNHAKSVEVRVLPDPSSIYLLGAPSTAKVWLVEEAMDLSRWRARWLSGETTDLVLLARQDQDHDGRVNLVEYGFSLNPTQADGPETNSVLPRARMRDGHLTVEFQKLIAATDLEYIVEVSDDLVNWRAGSQYVEEVAVPEWAGTPERVCFRDRTPSASAPHRYLRVRVKLK